MEDVKSTLKALEWSSSVWRVDKASSFPMIVKPAPETADKYGIMPEPVLLHHFWVTQRVVAQCLEDEGAYVVGPQMEIPSDYRGTFEYLHDQKGNIDVVQTYLSVKEIASHMPEKVFVIERLVVYPAVSHECQPPNGEKVKTVVLHPKEPLTVLKKADVIVAAQISRFAFGAKNRYKYVSVPCVVFHNEATEETINLPLSVRGKFSTISHTLTRGREYDFWSIVKEIDLPFNLTTSRNCPQTLLDEHFLRPGMRLRITAIEQHEVILGVTAQEKIVEFASDGVDFLIPMFLDRPEDKEREIAYQTALQRFLMECQIKNSPVNVRDYRKSIRNHVSRTVRPTAPIALNSAAARRTYTFVPPTTIQDGIPAIALLSSSHSMWNMPRRSSLPSERYNMPLPPPPGDQQDPTPPLPPRNSSLRVRSSRPMSVAVPPTTWTEWPSRPPPPPPLQNTTFGLPPPVPDRPKLRSASCASDFNSANLDEQIWGDWGEMSSTKPWENNDSEIKKTSYENVVGLSSQISELVVEISEKAGVAPVFSLDDLERSPSPEFEIETRDLTPVIPDPAEHPFYVVPSSVADLTDNSSYENVVLQNNNIILTEVTQADEGDVTESEVTQAEGNNPTEPTSTDGAAFAESSVTDTQQAASRVWSVSSRSSGSEGSEVERSNTPREGSSTSTSSSPASAPPVRQNGFRMSQYSVASDDTSVSHHVSFTCKYLSSPDGWTPPSELSGLTVNEITNSLRYIGMNEDTVEWFRAEKVDGSLLCGIEEDVLAEHFRLSPFQCKKLTLFRQGWRPKLN